MPARPPPPAPTSPPPPPASPADGHDPFQKKTETTECVAHGAPGDHQASTASSGIAAPTTTPAREGARLPTTLGIIVHNTNTCNHASTASSGIAAPTTGIACQWQRTFVVIQKSVHRSPIARSRYVYWEPTRPPLPVPALQRQSPASPARTIFNTSAVLDACNVTTASRCPPAVPSTRPEGILRPHPTPRFANTSRKTLHFPSCSPP